MWLLLCGFTLLHYVTSESCHYQRCLGCHPSEMFNPGPTVECHPSNWVTAEWVHNLGHPAPPPSTESKISVEYRCLKMIATPDDKSFGNTIDVIRGCVPRAQIDSVCLGLVAVERARGHSDARCQICRRNDCNSAQKQPIHTIFTICTFLFLYILR